MAYFPFSEGTVRKISSTSFRLEYNLSDHLGNVRATFYPWQYNSPVLLQADSYYPFGLKMTGLSYVASGSEENKFTYNGKELEDEFGLDWYHYGVRFYDPDGMSSDDPPESVFCLSCMGLQKMMMDFNRQYGFDDNGGFFTEAWEGTKFGASNWFNSKVDGVKSLGGLQGWKDLGSGLLDNALVWKMYPKIWNEITGTVDYWMSVPDMSSYDFGFSYMARTTPPLLDAGVMSIGYKAGNFISGRAPINGKFAASVFKTGPLSYESKYFGFNFKGGGLWNRKIYTLRTGWSYHNGNYVFRVRVGDIFKGDYLQTPARWGNTVMKKGG